MSDIIFYQGVALIMATLPYYLLGQPPTVDGLITAGVVLCVIGTVVKIIRGPYGPE